MTSGARVLQVIDCGNRAGTEIHVLRLSEGLRDRGWQVELAVSREGPILDEFRGAGIPIHHVSRGRGWDPRYLQRLRGVIRERRIEILHAHSGRFPVLAARREDLPAVETRHGLGAIRREGSSLRMRREAFASRAARMTMTVCACDRDLLVAAGLPEARVVHVPNGIPAECLRRVERAREDPFRLAFIGRLAEQKNPLFLIELGRALDRLAGDAWKLVVAGRGPLEGALRQGFEAVGAAARVEWMGELDRVDALLSRSDLLLLPSRWEGQPLVALEAMAAGVPILGARIDPLVELLEGSPAAGMTQPTDPPSWGMAVLDLARSPDRWTALSHGARERFERNHCLEPMVERIAEIYRRVLAGEDGG